MLCMIGDFQFTVDETSYNQFTSTTTYPFVVNERIADYNSYQDVGKEEHRNTITGDLIVKSMRALDDFEAMASLKKEQTIAFSTGKVYMILIQKITKTESKFLRDGAFLKQSYSIELMKVGE